MRLPDPLQLPFSTLHLTRPGFTAIGRSWQLDIALDDARPLRFFGLVALYDGPNENASINDELALRITDTIRYHKQLLEGSRVSVTVEDFFEQCLQKINSELNIFLRNYAKPLPVHHWAMLIGMLSLDDHPKRLQLSISRFGEIGGWLLHSAQLDTKKLISIFDSPDSLNPQMAPHKFFRNVLSSSLSKNDQLFFCTPNILNYISLSDLKKVLSMLSVNAAMKQLENQLNFSGNDSVVCALTMRLSPYPSVAHSEDARAVPSGSAQQSIDTLMSTETETQKLLSTTFGLNIKRFFTQALESTGNSVGRFMPKGQQALSLAWQRLRPARAETNGAMRTSIKRPSSSLRKLNLLSTNQTITKVPVWKKRMIWLAVPLLKMGSRLRQALGSFISSGLWKKPQFFVTFLLVIVGTSGLSYWRMAVNRHNRLVVQTKTELTTLKKSVDRIDAFLIVGRENDAASLLQETRASLASATDIEEVRDQRQQLESAMADQQRRLRKEILIEPTVLVANLADQLTSQPQAAVRVNKQFLIFGQNPRSYFAFSPETGTGTVQTMQTDLTSWNAVAPSGQELVFVAENKIVRLNLKTGTATSTVANTTAGLIGAGIYNDHLYTVAPAEQKILRSNRAPNFSVFTDWLKEPVDVSEARQIIVDGFIYVLMPNAIYTFNQGLLARVGGIQLDAIDPPLQDAKAFALPTDSKFIYVLETGRLIVYQKDGRLKAQYPAKDGQTFINLLVDEAAKSAYILTTTEFVSLSLPI